MTAAEALFGASNSKRSKGAVIAERAKVLDATLGANDLATLRDAYNLRNAAIHDGAVAEWKPEDHAMTATQLSGFVGMLAEILRRLLRTATLKAA